MREKLLLLIFREAEAAEMELSALGFDSLDTIELVRKIETEFGCEIPDADIERIRRVSDFFRYLPA